MSKMIRTKEEAEDIARVFVTLNEKFFKGSGTLVDDAKSLRRDIDRSISLDSDGVRSRLSKLIEELNDFEKNAKIYVQSSKEILLLLNEACKKK